MSSNIAFVTGLGQDSSFLIELLLEKGYEVHVMVRRCSVNNRERISHLKENDKLIIHDGEITDALRIYQLISSRPFTEIYSLAAQSDVGVSFTGPAATTQINVLGTIHLLEAMRSAGLTKTCKFYNASSSEQFGAVVETPQKETTPFRPQSPYALGKCFAHGLVELYRQSYNMFCVNGILFNHESERRGANFVTRKITLGIAAIQKGKQKRIILGNLDSKRDWGYSKEYVECMWRMLQTKTPQDYVVSTGETHTVREFVEKAFKYVGTIITWSGTGVDEVGKDQDGNIRVSISSNLYRPSEVDLLLGDATKVKQELGWEAKVKFEELVSIMMKHDLM